MTDLRVNLINGSNDSIDALQKIINKFQNLNKLYVYTEAYNQPADLIVPQFRHFIFDENFFRRHSDLYKLSCICPDLQILQLKQKFLTDVNEDI